VERFLCAARMSRYRGRVSVLPAEHEDPLDPERIMRALPERERETFLAQYRQAVDGAHESSGWAALRRMLHLWALRAVAVGQSGYYEARDRARAGVSSGGMLLDDAVGQYRPRALVTGPYSCHVLIVDSVSCLHIRMAASPVCAYSYRGSGRLLAGSKI
jgi:hypothetical protein